MGETRWGLRQRLSPEADPGIPLEPQSDPLSIGDSRVPGSQQTAARGNGGGAFHSEAERPPAGGEGGRGAGGRRSAAADAGADAGADADAGGGCGRGRAPSGGPERRGSHASR